ncbi:MAG TPA: glutamine-hydrolyzing GMP synthase [Proteobacteria bacterium]|nr:glutamine-hydrolyzing GMP synthase [Pseudomonadota bacterium]
MQVRPEGWVLILDFGSQYTQLIARRIREMQVYCEIQPFNFPFEEIERASPAAIILSGGPASVWAEGAPVCDERILSGGLPLLGICYGMQLMGRLLGGEVLASRTREYGPATLEITRAEGIFSSFRSGERVKVWMSHGDRIEKLPPGFVAIARSENSPFAAMMDESKRRIGVQFHPEVIHTERGSEMLSNFLFDVAKLKPNWTMASFIEQAVEEIRRRVGEHQAVCALSGGVDSTVAAVLVHRAIGERLHPIFVNNGVLRKGETQEVLDRFKRLGIDVNYVDASERFLSRLKGVVDPERKRKIIGEEFIRVFEEEAKKIRDARFLVQGTLYPDVIESVSFKGPSATIKSHHNVGGLPERMELEIIEPLRELFKDEVRRLGEELGLDKELVWRQPFPGPGLAVRIIGEVTEERLNILREADAIVQDEMLKSGLYYEVWQSFAVLLPVKSVGVMGDERTYENAVVIRCVHSHDGMTADWVRLPYDLLARISNRIINEVKGINRVCYDISTKPPSTIEWE